MQACSSAHAGSIGSSRQGQRVVRGDRDFDTIAFTVDMVRWPETVKLGLVPHGRHAASEFAGTKYISWAENLTRYERAHQQGLDEVILLNAIAANAKRSHQSPILVERHTTGEKNDSVLICISRLMPISAGVGAVEMVEIKKWSR